jgi:prepilin-type N-terminal cleavage/methylation domain-containing protein
MRRRRAERGVTLIELLIAVALVAAISTGMLMAMRTSLASLERTQGRLEDNRRTMGVQQLILRQIGGVIPVPIDCARFRGTSASLHLISTHSMNQGARGYPESVDYIVAPEPGGTLRLLLAERPYYGPVCAADAPAAPQPIVLAEHLAYCRFSYRELIPEALESGNWLPDWDRVQLPAAVRIEMAPAEASPSRLPMVSLHIPLHVTREVGAVYADQ